MPQIHKLDTDLVNKIAAGEVIERPASVVKELVENALDACARFITVILRDGGRKLIQISDDGCGIAPDELALAVGRHTTSKISSFDDLYRLRTMGFRGEALASICSVAQVSLASCVAGGEGAEILIEDGRVLDRRAAAQLPGTTVTVKYLFHQTPARLKFLKSPDTETSHIVDVVMKAALAHPKIAFKVLQNERTLFDVEAGQTPYERALQVLGRDLNGHLFAFSGEAPGMSLSGFVGHPQMARSQRGGSFFFVNGRPVQDKVLWHAVMEAHRDLLMKGRYPVIVLMLTVAAGTVDVNVHPTKAEVRFHQSQPVHGFVHEVLRGTLQSSPWLTQEAVGFDSSGGRDVVMSGGQDISTPLFSSHRISPSTAHDPQLTALNPQRSIRFGRTPFAALHVIGQFLGTYILCEGDDVLVLIDQHAAHERVGFERLLQEFERQGVRSEALLVPETFDLKPSDSEILKNYLDELRGYGFEIEFFGGTTFALKSVPTLLKGRFAIDALIADVVADIRETGELVALKDRTHHLLATMACHAQIRAHHHLAPEEIRALLCDLEQYQFTDFCPHGRPVSVEVTRDEIERWFKRVL